MTKERFGRDDTRVQKSAAFGLSPNDMSALEKTYAKSESLYFRGRPTLQEILDRMAEYMDRL